MARASVAQELNSIWGTMLRSAALGLAVVFPPLLVGALLYWGFSIPHVLAAILAMLILGFMFFQPEATTLIVLFVLYANLSVVAIRSYGVPDLLAASVFLLLILPLLQYVIVKRRPIIVNRVFVLMLIYLGACLLSAVASQRAAQSVDRIMSFILEGLVLYLLIINTVRTPAMLRGAIWAVILAGVLMGSISLYQELTGAYDNDFGGLALVKESGTIDTGRTDLLGEDVERQRLAGPLGSKNRYAQVMVVLLPLALARVWAERSLLLRIAGAASCIPIVGGALLTFSRGAGISIVLTLVAMVFLRTLKLHHFLIVLAAGSVFVAVAVPDYIYRLSTATEVADLASGNVETASGSVRGRATENLAALHIFLDHPYLGVGPGQTNDYTTEYGNAVGYRRLSGTRRAHNMYLEELGDTGAIGFSLFMGIILTTIYELFQIRHRWQRSRPDIAYTIAGVLLAVIAYLSTGVFLHLSYVRYYWLILALAGATVQIFGSVQTMEESLVHADLSEGMLLSDSLDARGKPVYS